MKAELARDFELMLQFGKSVIEPFSQGVEAWAAAAEPLKEYETKLKAHYKRMMDLSDILHGDGTTTQGHY